MRIQYILIFFIALNGLMISNTNTIQCKSLLSKPIINKKIRITVFVHGSLFTVLSLLDIANVYQDLLDENLLYKKLIKIIRINQLLEHEQLLFDLEDHLLDSILTLAETTKGYSKCEAKKAGNFILPAYHEFAKKIRPDEDVCYVSWGHYGFLSQKYRKEVAESLFHWICALRDYYLTLYEEVLIDGIGHSHGGNILLNLAHYEMIYNKKLMIDNLVLFGMPIQKETALLAYTHVFNRVVNCYAQHDIFQSADWLSTVKRKSFNCFAHKELLIQRPDNHQVFDIRLSYNNSLEAVNHANMWCLGRNALGGPACGDLPLMVMSPVILSLLDKNMLSNDCLLDLPIKDTIDTLIIGLAEQDKDPILYTDNLFSIINPVTQSIKDYWRPDYKCYLPVFNKKTLTLLTSALYQLCVESL